MSTTEITKVQIIIRRFLWETRDVVKDPEKSRIWLESFRNTLQYQDLSQNPEPYALALLSEARLFNGVQLRKQQIRWARESLKKEGIADPTKEQIEQRWAEMYGDATILQATANSQVTDEQRTGGHMLPSSSLQKSPVRNDVDVLSLAYGGEFQNVKLTQEQYNQLGIRFGNLAELNRAIDSLSCKLENEEIKPVPKNHYAVLLKWASYREDMDEKKELEESKPKMTNMEKSWIAAMKRVEEM